MGYAFISYSSKDQSPADSLRALLKKYRIESWMAPYDIPAGSNYAQVISKALKECSCLILLLTDSSQNSLWVGKEVERAINYRKPIIPIQLEEVILNDVFEFYISTDQIVAMPKIDESDIMKKVLKSVIAYAGQSFAESEVPTLSAKYANNTTNKSIIKFSEMSLDSINSENTDKISSLIIETLASFKINATIVKADVAPRYIRYQLVLEKGTKVSKILNIKDDIALALGNESIRIEAPIPGLSAIGIEVPRKNQEAVSLQEMLNEDKFVYGNFPTMFALGKNVNNESVFESLETTSHLLVAGAIGMGKTSFMHSLLCSLITKTTPEELRLILIDPHKISFTHFSAAPHLLVPVIRDAALASSSLKWAINEMDRRYNIFNASRTRNLSQYNAAVENDYTLGKRLPYIVIVIDELNDLMLQERKSVEESIMIISQKARAAGIYLVLGTQRPSADVITGVIKANIPSRIAFKTSSSLDSRIILDTQGAERLLGNGDMLFSSFGKTHVRLQCPYATDSDVNDIVFKAQSKIQDFEYDFEAYNEMQKLHAPSDTQDVFDEKDSSEEHSYLDDPKFLAAAELALAEGKMSIALLQRKLSIGYSRAAMFIDKLTMLGLISEPNGSKMRETLMSCDEWEQLLKKLKTTI